MTVSFIACTVCGVHPADESSGSAPGTTPSFGFEPCECCGTLILVCSPWPNHNPPTQTGWWERCVVVGCCTELAATATGHVRMLHTPDRCTAAREDELPPQAPVVDAAPPNFRAMIRADAVPRTEMRGIPSRSDGMYYKTGRRFYEQSTRPVPEEYRDVDPALLTRAAWNDAVAAEGKVWGEVRLNPPCPEDPTP